jgi:uncharacterized repeat protein (TIGR03803 family)
MAILSAALALTVALAMITAPLAQAQTFNLIYGFTGGADGGGPSVFARDSAGNLYGTAYSGGVYVLNQGYLNDYGTVFKLDRNGKETTLHTFNGVEGGISPTALVRDSAGNLYGTTYTGGIQSCGYGMGCGVVFKIDTHGNFSLLHNFQGGSDGDLPISLIMDSAGNLYGVTNWGGNCARGYGCGTIFKIDTHGIYTLLYSFTDGNDGRWPQGSLALDSAGNLYGTTEYGGSGGWGVVFKLSQGGQLTPLYSFNSRTGYGPYGVLLDSAGNLYGAVQGGGTYGAGFVYKLNPANQQYGVLYNFTGGNDGGGPSAQLAEDAAGILYGTASYGGTSTRYQGCYWLAGYYTTGCGVVFKLNPSSGQETVLHNFTGFADGGGPESGVILDPAGNIYSTASYLGPLISYANGTVFEIKP